MYNPLRSKKVIPGNELNFGGMRTTGLLRQEPRKNLCKRDSPFNGDLSDKRGFHCDIDGSKTIVVEYKMKVGAASHDTELILVYGNGLTTGDLIYCGSTNYATRGLWIYGGGIFGNVIATSGSVPTAGTYYEYRLTVNGTAIKGERGPTLAGITHTLNQTMSVSASGKKFYLALGSGGSSYPGGYFDWIRVYSGGDLIFNEDFTQSAVSDEIWEYQANLTWPGDGSLGVGIGTGGGIARNLSLDPVGITYGDRDCSYNSKMAVFNGTSSVITDVSKNANCRSMSDTQKWTISFAYKPTGNSGANALIMQSYSGGAGWWASKTSAEKLNFSTANSGGATYKSTVSTASLAQNAIHHIILEWDGTTLTQYVNLQSTSETKSGSVTKTDTLQIGGTGAYGYHSMEVAKVKYFNHILSAREKLELFNEVFKILH